MFLIGFISGVLLLMLLVMLCDDGKDRLGDEDERPLLRQEVQSEQHRRQTHNFLYYDGTEMPIKKEDLYE